MAESRTLTVLLGGGQPAFATDRKGRMLACNEAADQLLGCGGRCDRSSACYEVIAGRDGFGNRFCDKNCPLRGMVHRGERVRPFCLYLHDQRGQLIAAHISVRLIPGAAAANSAIVHSVKLLERDQEISTWWTHGGREQPRSRAPCYVGCFADTGPEALTRRERQVLCLLCEGKSTADIANLLSISSVTVRNHIEHLLGKMGVHSRLEAVALASRRLLCDLW